MSWLQIVLQRAGNLKGMAGAIRTILLIFGVVTGMIMLQAPAYWVANRYSPFDNGHAAILSSTWSSPQLEALTSGSDFESRDGFRPLGSSSESTLFKQESSKPAADPIPQKKSSYRPLSLVHYAFVLFNTYRYSLQTFYVVGTTSVVVRKFENDLPVYSCEWVPCNGSQFDYEKSVITKATMLYVGFDENRETYVPAIVNCTFNQTVGEDNLGGLLRLHLSNGPNFWGPHEAVETVLEEKPQSVRREFLEGMNESSLQYKYVFCGPPVHGSPSMTWIEKWLAYHHFLWKGSVHFYFYDVGGMSEAGRGRLAPWVKAGLLTIINGLGEDTFPSWYRNQVLFLNDCLYRARFTSRWVFFQDLDEFIHIPAPNTLESLLEENKDVPWMSFASIPASLDSCRPNSSVDEWPLERMMWVDKKPECRQEEKDPWLCLAGSGRRKLVVNPEKVMLVGVHKTAIPEDGGIDFNGTIARVHHYHGALDPNKKLCNSLVSDDGPGWMQFDDSVANLARDIRKNMDSQIFSLRS